MAWRFSDGTIAYLGGEIVADSVFARELWADLANPPAGVGLYPGPGGGVTVDVNDAALFDAWLKQEMERPFRRDLKLTLVERPEGIPPIPPDPRVYDDDDDHLDRLD